MYEIIDLITKQRVGGVYSCLKRARTRANKLDLEYGAYRYAVQEVS